MLLTDYRYQSVAVLCILVGNRLARSAILVLLRTDGLFADQAAYTTDLESSVHETRALITGESLRAPRGTQALSHSSTQLLLRFDSKDGLSLGRPPRTGR